MRTSASSLLILALPFANAYAGESNDIIPVTIQSKISHVVQSAQSQIQESFSIKHRFLDENSDDLVCLIATFAMGLNPVGSFENVSDEICNRSTLVCDLSSTEAAEKAKCDVLGGKIISDDMLICKEDFGDEQDMPDGDVKIINAPICLASSCKDNMQLVDLFTSMKPLLDMINAGGTEVPLTLPKSFLGEKCDSGAFLSSARGSDAYGSFLLASTAIIFLSV
eukprot:CAMPEP_0197823998 /NCGR_PEP_ID=MMETSP1437-20131217/1313_1 /TAXON_ID=49252 ORGANISM="Eucampia antarctica, Strain CCMP1452" /NCGR_SAMPLE_ID=MMETSP1437 /ASSEMBLY_ACC=CAM_ASM_001096 /LENGTH=222 /DNA_ID=CAMNT_0043423451 /DNA_START=88 /DNA_END=756 /DNA_ORIENTATION=+